jgi:hypothetical protein
MVVVVLVINDIIIIPPGGGGRGEPERSGASVRNQRSRNRVASRQMPMTLPSPLIPPPIVRPRRRCRHRRSQQRGGIIGCPHEIRE